MPGVLRGAPRAPRAYFCIQCLLPFLLMSHFDVNKFETQWLQEGSVLALRRHVVHPWTWQLCCSLAVLPAGCSGRLGVEMRFTWAE